MKNLIPKAIASLVVSGVFMGCAPHHETKTTAPGVTKSVLAAGRAGPAAETFAQTFKPSSSTNSPPFIFEHPQSRDALVGTSLNPVVIAAPPAPLTEDANSHLTYQWKINGAAISAATNFNYSITNVQFIHAGTYTVTITGGASMGFSTTNSLPAHLTVFDTNYVSGNGGTAKTPIGEFTSSGVCQNVSFDRYVVKAWFDGPNITSPLVPSPNWPNPSSLPKLTIDTFASENGTMLDTAVQIAQNWFPYTTLCCNDNTPPPAPLTDPNLSKCDITMQTNKQYRAGIFFKSSSLPAGVTNIYWRWNYHM